MTLKAYKKRFYALIIKHYLDNPKLKLLLVNLIFHLTIRLSK